ncbi:oxidoreductase [Mycobacterium sp. CBMA 234]|uniref:NAD(P)H-dependent flavin oxidoreductase n=1 Tax=Mycolicibacterium sp. CBMA 234 TaxID=1918495 RepID=UPI0012DDFE1A|nr:nitronate monooxygenase [Mycolicibacterium sp. CBMA 234]MUL67696.1 oxidoreductase [Mycolicibacterium sp. CBMA 234]
MITTRFTSQFGLSVPIALAPMAAFADGRLAGAVSQAGGLGILGAGYSDSDWLDTQFAIAAGTRVGVGFIAWKLAERPELLDLVLDHEPAAVVLSFGDPTPFAERIHTAKVPLFVQVNDLDEARRAIDVGVDVLVAQGGEAGGHGKGIRSTFTLVPEVADLVADQAPNTLVLAAGGVADGRGLAAALSLGADGALVGSRLWAAQESPVNPAARDRALAAGSDDTVRSTVFDIVRGYPWPQGYGGRVLRNDFVRRWHGNETALQTNLVATQSDYRAAVEASDFDTAAVHISEAVGIIRDNPTAAAVIERMELEAAAILGRLSYAAQ